MSAGKQPEWMKEKVDTSSSTPWYHIFTKGDPEYDRYMAEEWGFEVHDDQQLFEMLILEGAQAGLSWQTILKKREGYRSAFHNFDINKVAAMTEAEQQRLLTEGSGIVRNRLKVKSAVTNAKVALKIQEDEGSLDKFLWSFIGGVPRLNASKARVAESAESQAMSKALKQRGMNFVGPTIVYAFMQACGMVVDHPLGTPEWEAARERLSRAGGGGGGRGAEEGRRGGGRQKRGKEEEEVAVKGKLQEKKRRGSRAAEAVVEEKSKGGARKRAREGGARTQEEAESKKGRKGEGKGRGGGGAAKESVPVPVRTRTRPRK